MVNLLGEPAHFGKVKYEGLEKIIEIEGVFPHIYGKSDTKPFRKMGHITIINSSLDKAKEIAFKVKETIKAIGE
jgi:5-(carboxyamino)imidazole ribonucleotide synthase